MTRTHEYAMPAINIERLAHRIRSYLQEKDFHVAYSKDTTEPRSWYYIQAMKTSILRTIGGARRSTDITIRRKDEAAFTVSLSTGEWGKNILSSAPLAIVPPIGVAATVAKLYGAKRFSNNLWKFIEDQIAVLGGAASSYHLGTIPSEELPYNAVYIGGYPAWDKQIDGTLILERNENGNNYLIFRPKKFKGQEISIPTVSISKAEIITKGKTLKRDDRLIRIVCQDKNDQFVFPVFNLEDKLIGGVLAGINELIEESIELGNYHDRQQTALAHQNYAPAGIDQNYGKMMENVDSHTSSLVEGENKAREVSDVCKTCYTLIPQHATICPNCLKPRSK